MLYKANAFHLKCANVLHYSNHYTVSHNLIILLEDEKLIY